MLHAPAARVRTPAYRAAKMMPVALLLLLLQQQLRAGSADGGRLLYVSAAHGDDAASGSQAHPLSTLQRAVAVAASSSAAGSSAATIYLEADAAGTMHRLERTLFLGANHSGLTIATAPADFSAGRRATLSGGVAVQFHHNGELVPGTNAPILRAAAPPELKGRGATQLFMKAGTERATRARIPNIPPVGSAARLADPRGMQDANTLHWHSPILPCTGKHPTEWGNQPCPLEDARGFVFAEGDINASWYDLANVELLYFQSWNANHYRIASVTQSNNTVMIQDPKTTYGVTGFFGQYEKAGGKRYIVENVRGSSSPITSHRQLVLDIA